MLKNLKIELIDNINLIIEIAKKKLPSFPNDLTQFIQNEFDHKNLVIAKEISVNKFEVINKSATGSINQSKIFELKDYKGLKKSLEPGTDQIIDCKIVNQDNGSNISSFLIVTREITNFLLIFENKFELSKGELDNLRSLLNFVQSLLKFWLIGNDETSKELSISSLNFLSVSTQNLIKEIKTNNGLLSLVKEERLSKNVENYFNEIKRQNTKVIKHLNQLSELIELETKNLFKDGNHHSILSIIKNCKSKIKNEIPNLLISDEKVIDRSVNIDRIILEGLILNLSILIAHSSTNNQISIGTEFIDEKQLNIELNSKLSNSSKERFREIFDSSNDLESLKVDDGFQFALVKRYLLLSGGKLRFGESDGEFVCKILMPVKITDPIEIKENSSQNVRNGKDKILLIESDEALNSLLKNHLSKWEYSTEIVSTGEQAIERLSKNKYLAIILNIEQDNDNSLHILQRIKNQKENRNTPVIVFSVEPEKDQIYLMGPVEYLVKPVNYNNLIEILASYKLKLDSIVLCVDDDLPTLNLLKQAVNTAGFKAIAINRSEKVIEEIEEKDVDLAIIDLDMPIVNGFDLIRNIKSLEKYSKLPIIIYTGQEDYQNDLEKVDGLFVDLLEKRSTSIQELENTIIQMIDNYEDTNKIDHTTDSYDGPKILMAEDYKHSQIIVSRLLKKSGFTNIIVVENGEEALNICENDKIDLILMDMQMPIMNGFEATAKIRELPGYVDTPIISLTAFAMKGDREKCLDAGATDYIPKPIDSKEFIEKVQYYTQTVVSK